MTTNDILATGSKLQKLFKENPASLSAEQIIDLGAYFQMEKKLRKQKVREHLAAHVEDVFRSDVSVTGYDGSFASWLASDECPVSSLTVGATINGVTLEGNFRIKK